jgi:prolyl-tRNA editing enzyme YbaK/EbsC (Cys-tRNA(Pro) deacylase)
MAAGLSELLADFEIRRFPEGTRTAADAARAIGCSLGQIVKSLVFTAGGEPVVVLMSGSNRVDLALLGELTNAAVGKADAELTRSATGFAIGGVPPFGHSRVLPVYMDRDLLQYDVVWAAAGRPDSVFEISPERLRVMSGASMVDLK